MLDARRMEVYAAVYQHDHSEVRETRAEILEDRSFTEYLEKGAVSFIGNGVAKFKTICTHPNAVFVEEAMPSAVQMAEMAQKKYTANQIEDVAYFEPFYLKDFVGG